MFSVRGTEASLEEVATEAGLGVGTVHRAFGSKDALIEALYSDALENAVALIRRCAEAETGWEALGRVMRELTDLQVRDRAMQTLLYQGADPDAQLLRRHIEPLLTMIIERAKAEGALRGDFAATDIPLLTRAAATTADGLPGLGLDLARRHIAFVLKGIAATPPDEGPVPRPLTDDEISDWFSAIS